MKKILSILLVAILVITSMVFSSGCNSANPASDFEYSISDDGKYAGIEKYIGSDKSVVIPTEIDGATVTQILGAAFMEQDIESVIIPDTVVNISAGAFSACTKLTKVKFGIKVANIGENAFDGCVSLEEIDLPDSVILIEESAFKDCTALKTISIPNQAALYSGAFYNNSSLVSVNFEDGAKSLGGYSAFMHAESLAEVTIPASVEQIRNRLFNGCKKLNKVTFLGDAPTKLGKTVFGPENKDLKIYYKKGTKGWDTTDLAKWYTLVEY